MREVLIPHVEPVRSATAIRSTVVQSSLATLRARGHFEAWSTRVDATHRAEIIESIAPTWMPIAVASAHYGACEALELPLSEWREIGAAVGERIQGTFMATLMKSARSAGLDPLSLLGYADRLYTRLVQGGSVQLSQTGPKDVELELRDLPLCRYACFRTGFIGVVSAGFMFAGARKNHVKQQSYDAARNVVVLHAAWV